MSMYRLTFSMFLLLATFLFCFHVSFCAKQILFTKFGKGRLIIIIIIIIIISISTYFFIIFHAALLVHDYSCTVQSVLIKTL